MSGAGLCEPGRSETLNPLARILRRSILVWALMAAALVIAGVLFLVPSGYYVLEPGLARPLADVEVVALPAGVVGRPARPATAGRFLYVTVAAGEAGIGRFLVSLFDPRSEVVPRGRVLPLGQGQGEYLANALREKSESELIATTLALRAGGRDVRLTGNGVRVLGVFRGSPAAGKLRSGDLIVGVEGRPVAGAEDLWNAMRQAPGLLEIAVVRGGATIIVPVDLPGEAARWGPIALGLQVVSEYEPPRFPRYSFPLDVSGPSAGLMFTLELLERLAPGDLTGGRVIAGTGTVWPSGRVGPVGGVRHKVIAARRAGADVFLVPAVNLPEARRVAGRMRVVPIGTVGDALDALGGTS